MKCFECDGEYKKIVQDYEFITNKGTKMIVPDMEILTCNICGDKCLDEENSKKNDRAKDIATEGINFVVDCYKKCLEALADDILKDIDEPSEFDDMSKDDLLFLVKDYHKQLIEMGEEITQLRERNAKLSKRHPTTEEALEQYHWLKQNSRRNKDKPPQCLNKPL